MTAQEESEEVLRQYLSIATSYSIPLFWGKSDTGISANGTAFVLDTGECKFVVTAAHVYRSYIAEKQNGTADFCQLSDLDFELEDRLISIPGTNEVDIASFEITDNEIDSLRANTLCGSNQSWPPPRPEEGSMVVVSGFPGLERLRLGDNYYSLGYYCFNTPVSTSSNRHFGCSFERQYWIDPIKIS